MKPAVCRLCSHVHTSRESHKLIGGPAPSKSVRDLAAVAEPVTVVDAGEMTPGRARALTDRIKRAGEELWRLIEEAHRAEAWKHLGYESWRAYVASEFPFTQRRAYQLVELGRAQRVIEAPNVKRASQQAQISERDARAVRERPEIVQAVGRGKSIAKAVEEALSGEATDQDCGHEWVCRKCGAER